jgi:hypothetical protein
VTVSLLKNGCEMAVSIMKPPRTAVSEVRMKRNGHLDPEAV